MSENRTVGVSGFVGVILVLLTACLWNIADRLMDIHNDLRAASAMSAGTAATPKSGAGLQPASAVPKADRPKEVQCLKK